MELEKAKFSSEAIFHDSEGRRWLDFSLYMILVWEFHKKDISSSPTLIPLHLITPHKWRWRDMLITLHTFLRTNGGLYIGGFLGLGEIKNKGKVDQEVVAMDIYDFFEGELYMSYPEESIKKLILTIDKPISKKVLWKINDELAYENFWFYKQSDNYRKTAGIILTLFESLYRLYGRRFEITQNALIIEHKIEYISMVSLLFFTGLVAISWLRKRTGKTWEVYVFDIALTDEFIEILDAQKKQKDFLMTSIFEEKCKEITIRKKNGRPHMMERKIEVSVDETRFVELQKKYPHAEITATTYDGRTTKYEIKEKIRLDKET